MSIKVEKTDKTNELKLTFTVEAEKFDEGMKTVYKKTAKYFSIPGFRKGKAPMSIIERTYGSSIFYEDTFNEIVPEIYEKELKENNIEAVSRPEIEITQMEKGKDLIFTAVVQTKPEVKLGKYKGVEVEKIDTSVVAADVKKELDRMAEKNARMVSVDNRAVKNKDIAVIDFEGFVNGVPFEGGKAENHSLEIGSGQFIPGFEDQMIGMTCENEKDVVVTFPEDYQATELAGKEATFKVTVHEIKEKTLPEADDELAKDVNIDGVETLDQLKDHIKTQLKSQKETEVENKFFADLTSALIECCKVEDSEALLNSELDTMLREVEMNLQQQGLSFELYEQFTGKNKDAIKADLTDQAKDRVKLNLILAAIVEAENIEVTDEERNSELETIANTYNRDLEEIKQIFAQNMYQIDADILNRKALDVVKENLKK